VDGVPAAGKVTYIEEVVVHVREGYELVSLAVQDHNSFDPV
jgi:hypothetical protein